MSNLEINRNLNNALARLYMPESTIANQETDNNKEKDLSFGDIISYEINKLNNKQLHADNMVEEFISGEGEDLHSIMIATEEARISMELAVQVRNKLIEALNTVNNMQL